MQSMFGVLPAISGDISINGKVINGSISTFMKNKVAMLPSNRKENSVVPDMDILENTYIAQHAISSKKPIIKKKKEIKKYERLKDMLKMKAQSFDDSINSFSGCLATATEAHQQIL